MTDLPRKQRVAPWLHIPQHRIVSVEHPGIVKNVDRAIATLQGNDGIIKILNPPKANTPAKLSLRPEDPMSRPVQSLSTGTNNILLKVTVPKWTGRKRKRGTNGPFVMDESESGSAGPDRRPASTRLRSLQDNVGRYTVEPVGRVERTHTFRSIPDFVYSTAGSSFTQKFREHILPFDFEKMKQFDISMNRGETQNVDIIPPPSFSHADIAFQYTYRQNPTVRMWQDNSGQINSVNTQQGSKVLTHLVPYDIPVVPSEPRENCPSIPSLDPILQETIAILEELFTDRVAWTRRALRNMLKTPEQRYVLRHAIAYVGYIFRSGPWRDAIVKLGHDPRTSVESRRYQTFVFRVLPREPDVARDGGGSARRHTLPRSAETGVDVDSGTASTLAKREGLDDASHLWTGKAPLPLDGKIWMVCDIVDPIVKNVLFPENPPANFLRSECDILGDGWFGNGTIAKAKTIIRGKIHTLTQQNREADDAEFQCVLGFPDHARGNDENLVAFHMDPETATSREMALATEVRATIKGVASWQKLVAETRAGGNFPWVTADGREKQGASVVDQKTDAATVDQEVDDEAAATRRVMEEAEAEAEVDEDEEDAFMREDIAAIANTQAEQANSERRDQQERTIMEDDEDDEEDDDAEGRSEDSDDDEDEDEDV